MWKNYTIRMTEHCNPFHADSDSDSESDSDDEDDERKDDLPLISNDEHADL
jgi:hypothetical protein